MRVANPGSIVNPWQWLVYTMAEQVKRLIQWKASWMMDSCFRRVSLSSRQVFPWLNMILFHCFNLLPPSWADKTFDDSDFDDEAYYAALGTRPPINMEELDETYQQVIELFSLCTNENPKDRPSAGHIVEALEADIQWSPQSWWPELPVRFTYILVLFTVIHWLLWASVIRPIFGHP